MEVVYCWSFSIFYALFCASCPIVQVVVFSILGLLGPVFLCCVLFVFSGRDLTIFVHIAQSRVPWLVFQDILWCSGHQGVCMIPFLLGIVFPFVHVRVLAFLAIVAQAGQRIRDQWG